jgi:hypothetical protein
MCPFEGTSEMPGSDVQTEDDVPALEPPPVQDGDATGHALAVVETPAEHVASVNPESMDMNRSLQDGFDRFLFAAKEHERIRQRRLEEQRESLYSTPTRVISPQKQAEFYQRQLAWKDARTQRLLEERSRMEHEVQAASSRSTSPWRSPTLRQAAAAGAPIADSTNIEDADFRTQLRSTFETECAMLAGGSPGGPTAAARARALEEFMRRQDEWLAMREARVLKERKQKEAAIAAAASSPARPGTAVLQRQTDWLAKRKQHIEELRTEMYQELASARGTLSGTMGFVL